MNNPSLEPCPRCEQMVATCVSDTPRTDAEDAKPINSYGDHEFIKFSRMRDFARTLEARLAEALKQLLSSTTPPPIMVELERLRLFEKDRAEWRLQALKLKVEVAKAKFEHCRDSVNRQYPLRRDSNGDSKYLLWLSKQLNEALSHLE